MIQHTGVRGSLVFIFSVCLYICNEFILFKYRHEKRRLISRSIRLLVGQLVGQLVSKSGLVMTGWLVG